MVRLNTGMFSISSRKIGLNLEELVTRRLVVEVTNERFALSHPLIRETLVHHLSQLRGRTIHRQLAAVLEACPALRKDFPLEVARTQAAWGETALLYAPAPH